jgi:hypothetical protein
MDVGQSQTFTATATGGTPPYTYEWFINGNQVQDNSSSYNSLSTYIFTPNTTGKYTISAKVADSLLPIPITLTASVTVNPTPSVSITPASVILLSKGTVTFNSSIQGGTAGYAYMWYLNGEPLYDETWPMWAFTPTPGFYTICLQVVDGAGFIATSNNATVTAGCKLQLSANMTVPNLTFTVNGTAYINSVNTWLWKGNYTITVSPTEEVVQYKAGEYVFADIWLFDYWSNPYGSSATITINLSANTSLTAYYTYEVTIGGPRGRATPT